MKLLAVLLLAAAVFAQGPAVSIPPPAAAAGATASTDLTDSAILQRYTAPLIQQFIAGTGGVTANTLVKFASDGTVIAITGTESILGIAQSTATAGNAVNVILFGPASCVAEGAITAGHYLIAGTTNPARCKDSGQSARGLILTSVRIAAKAAANATDGNTFAVDMLGPNLNGEQLDLSTAIASIGLPAANLPAFTGDATSSAGSAALTVSRINGVQLSSLATGMYKWTAGVPSAAVAGTDFVSPAGNVATATALAANPANCGTALTPAGVDASGVAENCNPPLHPVNVQSGTTYTFVNSDCGKLVIFTNASPATATLPQAGASSNFTSGCMIAVESTSGGVTVNPTTSTLDGITTITARPGAGFIIFSDGSNYYTMRGRPTDVSITLTDITTNNTSASNHGFMPKLGGDAKKFFDGNGGQTTPGTLLPIVTKTSNYTVSATAGTDYTIVCDTTSGAVTISMPATPASGSNFGQIVNVKWIGSGANACTIGGNGHNIESAGNAGASTYTPGALGVNTMLQYDINATIWRVM